MEISEGDVKDHWSFISPLHILISLFLSVTGIQANVDLPVWEFPVFLQQCQRHSRRFLTKHLFFVCNGVCVT